MLFDPRWRWWDIGECKNVKCDEDGRGYHSGRLDLANRHLRILSPGSSHIPSSNACSEWEGIGDID